MRSLGMAGVLVAAMAWAQMNSAASGASSNAGSTTGEVRNGSQKADQAAVIAPNAAVITIQGLCAEPASHSATHAANAGCETVVTRAQFEKLADVLHMEKGSSTWHQLGSSYPQILVMAHEAERRGVDKQPRFEERLRFARLQILSQELIRQLREEAAQVPEKDVADYYQKNSKEFEKVSLERIVIPNRPQRELPASRQGAEKPEEAMTAEAELLHTRALQGEDFAKLEKEAYDFAGVSGNSEANPKLDMMRRRGLPPTHAGVFDLKVGEVSKVISDATAHYIYKLDAREIAPLESVKMEITTLLRQQRTENVVQAIQQPFTTSIDQEYFGAVKNDD
jgi:hypothetical protein